MPKWQRMDNLPKEYKERIEKKYLAHIEWLKDKDRLTRATKGFESALKWMNMNDNTKNLPMFFELSKKYDSIRGESLVKTFPELTELFEKYEKN
jgi:hypothetical protein